MPMKKQKYFFLVLVFLLFLMVSCHHRQNGIYDISSSKRPKVSLSIHRYEKALFAVDTAHFKQDVKGLKEKFPYFLDADLDNPSNLRQLYTYVIDTQLIHLYRTTEKTFPDLNTETRQIADAFSYLKYYFPDYKLPQVYTYVSGMYFEQPVLKKDTVLVVALDDYLGRDFEPYAALHIPLYHRRCMDRRHMSVDVLRSLYMNDFYIPLHSRTLLDKMVEAGKELYFLDAMMPDVADSVKICYTSAQMKWMKAHKRDVWAVFVQNRFLYSTDYLIITKLTHEGPFTEGFSHQSPPRMAAWFGWQMVRAYMDKNPEKQLKDLLKMKNAQEMLQASEYKP